jgi:hypothetical protein
MVKPCKATLHTHIEDHNNKLLTKSPLTEVAWNSTLKKLEMLKWQKVVLFTQIESMRSGNQ